MQPSDSTREEGPADLGPTGWPSSAPITVDDRADASQSTEDGPSGEPADTSTAEPADAPTDGSTDGEATDVTVVPGPPAEPEPPRHPGLVAGATTAELPSFEPSPIADETAGDDPGTGDPDGPDDTADPDPGTDTIGDPDTATDPVDDSGTTATDDTSAAATETVADAAGERPETATGERPNPVTTTDAPTGWAPVAASPVAPDRAPSRGPGVGRRLALIGAASVVGLYLLITAAWAVDAATHRDEVMRGVEIGGIDVGGADREALAAVVSTLTDRLAAEDLEVTVGSETITTDPVALGAVLDGETIADEALAARRGGLLPLRPIGWAAGLFSSHDVTLHHGVDPTAARQGVSTVILPELLVPVEPRLEIEGDELAVSPGSDGTTVDPQLVIDGLPATIEAGAPYRLELPEEVAIPEIDEGELTDLAVELNASTSQPIAIQVLDKRVQVSPATQRSWIRVERDGGELAWSVDEDAALADLKPLFPVLGSEDQQARFEVVDEVPIIVPASETVVCCAEGSAATLAETIDRPIPVAVPPEGGDDQGDGSSDDIEDPELRVANLEPEITGFDEGVAELESLGIVEQVSTFTTEHKCCQNRVTNIHRIADLTRGVIIRPGEEFSLNGFVGRRTRENGFVADGAIEQGNFEQQVGGGISQFATTFFNASFFAGIEFVEYQSHSIYISRYPRGREATISWPKPDLAVRNDTPYGILVWTEYTDTSITVSFYSTKHLDVEALPLLRSSERQCRIDITPRQITHEDGTVTEDRVFAVYRPGEGLDCNGESTVPEEETPEPTSRSAGTPGPQPPPDPEPPGTGGGTDGDGGDGDGEVVPAD